MTEIGWQIHGQNEFERRVWAFAVLVTFRQDSEFKRFSVGHSESRNKF